MSPARLIPYEPGITYGDQVGEAVTRVRPSLRRAIPPFVLGFLALAALRPIGLWTHFRELRETSWRPLAIGLGVAIVFGLGSLAAIDLLGLGSGLG